MDIISFVKAKGAGVKNGVLTMTDAIKLQTYGKHIASKYDSDNETYVYNATTVMDSTGTIETFYLEYQSEETRVVTHGNNTDKSGANKDGAAPEVVDTFTYDFVGTHYEYSVVPSQDYILTRLYYMLGNTLTASTGDVFRVRAYRGTSINSTKLIFESSISVGSTGQTLDPNGEVYVDIPNLEYSVGEEFHWVIDFVSSNTSHQVSIKTNSGNAQPWRAVDRLKYERKQLAPYGVLFPAVTISAPTSGATGQSLTPTVTSAKGTVQLIGGNPTQLDYTFSQMQVQARNKATQELVYNGSAVASLSETIPTGKLGGATYYELRVRHKSSAGIWLPWSSWTSFKTTFTKTITITTTGVTAGDLVEIKIGESATASGYDFHINQAAVTFPPAAFDSGSFQFNDSAAVALNFAVTSVTGVTPNRVATCAVETNVTVISNGTIILSDQS